MRSNACVSGNKCVRDQWHFAKPNSFDLANDATWLVPTCSKKSGRGYQWTDHGYLVRTTVVCPLVSKGAIRLMEHFPFDLALLRYVTVTIELDAYPVEERLVKIRWFSNGEALARMLVLQCCFFIGFGANRALGGKFFPFLGLLVGGWITSHMKLGKPHNLSVFRHWEMWAGVVAFAASLWTGDWVGGRFGHDLIGIGLGGLIAITISDRIENHVNNRYFSPRLDGTVQAVR